MKDARKMTLLKILIPVLIIGGCIAIEKIFTSTAGAESNKPVTVCQNSSELMVKDDKPLEVISNKRYGELGEGSLYGFTKSNEAIIRIGSHTEKDNGVYLFKLNLLTLEKKPLNIDTDWYSAMGYIDPTVNKIAYSKDSKLHIYDLKNDSDKTENYDKVPKGIYGGIWSQDGNSLIVDGDSNNLKIYNIKKKTQKTIKIKNLYTYETQSMYSEDGKNIYIIGIQRRYKDKKYAQSNGVFRINTESGKTEKIFAFPYQVEVNGVINTNIDRYSLVDKDKKILFSGRINGKSGLFVYDVSSKKLDTLVSTIETTEGSQPVSFWISPDKNKIIYYNLELENNKENWNLYAGKISGNKLDEKICLEKDAFLQQDDVKWNTDSKSILFFTPKDKDKTHKQEINLITFK